MNWSLSDLIRWGSNEMADPDWPRKFTFWSVILIAAWLLLRGRSSSSRSR
ncbi:MAG TPA: hypothetical protein VFM42_08090 [Sphingomicrobium sp.]|jgi:hypothetical protein|nr:hypothetical protein [Sphingomicrobium sp.]